MCEWRGKFHSFCIIKFIENHLDEKDNTEHYVDSYNDRLYDKKFHKWIRRAKKHKQCSPWNSVDY